MADGSLSNGRFLPCDVCVCVCGLSRRACVREYVDWVVPSVVVGYLVGANFSGGLLPCVNQNQKKVRERGGRGGEDGDGLRCTRALQLYCRWRLHSRRLVSDGVACLVLAFVK